MKRKKIIKIFNSWPKWKRRIVISAEAAMTGNFIGNGKKRK